MLSRFRTATCAPLAAALAALAAGAAAQPEPSAADAGKGQTPPPPAEQAGQPPASADASASERAEKGPARPASEARRPPSPDAAPRPLPPEQKDKSPPQGDTASPARPKVTGGLVAEAGGGVAGSLLLKGVGVAIGGPIGGFAASFMGGKLGAGAVHMGRRLFHHGKASAAVRVQEAQAAPPPFDPGPLLEVPGPDAPGR